MKYLHQIIDVARLPNGTDAQTVPGDLFQSVSKAPTAAVNILDYPIPINRTLFFNFWTSLKMHVYLYKVLAMKVCWFENLISLQDIYHNKLHQHLYFLIAHISKS